MKKLKLKLSGVKEMLSREQMKNIHGGYEVLKCLLICSDDTFCSVSGPNCGYVTLYSSEGMLHYKEKCAYNGTESCCCPKELIPNVT